MTARTGQSGNTAGTPAPSPTAVEANRTSARHGRTAGIEEQRALVYHG
ncbi:MAG: hypothetical protein M0P29_05940 [Sphaerochaetaceae bacterium]|nr:hypothetical protein [Sphaerochaetaceae bacterium]MDX9934620.1 hypothetical protein [Sphaerochaetaceae bacterium]